MEDAEWKSPGREDEPRAPPGHALTAPSMANPVTWPGENRSQERHEEALRARPDGKRQEERRHAGGKGLEELETEQEFNHHKEELKHCG